MMSSQSVVIAYFIEMHLKITFELNYTKAVNCIHKRVYSKIRVSDEDQGTIRQLNLPDFGTLLWKNTIVYIIIWIITDFVLFNPFIRTYTNPLMITAILTHCNVAYSRQHKISQDKQQQNKRKDFF